VSLLRALSDDIGEKAMAMAHQKGIDAAMAYLHEHAGYTWVHNPLSGNKDLQRLPGLVGIAYQHETSRCGDPHLHTHVIVPNRQARADGTLVSIDSKSLHHEAKAAGIIYQATMAGARDDRPGLVALLDYVRAGDTVVVWKLDRLGRNTLHILETFREVRHGGNEAS
jgi:conjugative relaxase-like TrwC/TraI family protein